MKILIYNDLHKVINLNIQNAFINQQNLVINPIRIVEFETIFTFFFTVIFTFYFLQYFLNIKYIISLKKKTTF